MYTRSDFIDLISTNRAIVVTGETGCGKTTQIPQFINEINPNARIVVCQPRRLAAIGVATRVSDEMAGVIGEKVRKGGHKICICFSFDVR